MYQIRLCGDFFVCRKTVLFLAVYLRVQHQIPVFRGRAFLFFFKAAIEGGNASEAGLKGDFSNGDVPVFEQQNCLLDTLLCYIIAEAALRIFMEGT